MSISVHLGCEWYMFTGFEILAGPEKHSCYAVERNFMLEVPVKFYLAIYMRFSSGRRGPSSSNVIVVGLCITV
jgi:hypothetical protein